MDGLNTRVRYDNLIAADPSSSAKRRLTYGEEGDDTENDEADDSPPNKLARIESGTGDDGDDSSVDDEEFQPQQTHEQEAILSHVPVLGASPVCVNALAGCGKTTTIAMLCNHLHEKYANWKILYLVFGKKNQDEAMASKKFPKNNMEIRTTHAFVLRHYFGVAHMNSFQPQDDYTLEDIIETLDLISDLKQLFPDLDPSSRKFKRIQSSVASYIRKTVHNFQASDHDWCKADHIFFRAKHNTNLGTRSAWRNQIPVKKYQLWAYCFFSKVKERCHRVRDHGQNVAGISHDGYLKVAQLETDLTSSFQVVIVDEAQDLTPCQAKLFWGIHARTDRAIYLFGDPYQQLYRFFGASDSFRNMCGSSQHRFQLTGSFRFGREIANMATVVLKAVGGIALIGRALEPGEVHHRSHFGDEDKGVVLCRTNQGINKYLFFHHPSRWAFLDGRTKAFPSPPKWVNDLEDFVLFMEQAAEAEAESQEEPDNEDFERVTFKYKGEVFVSLEALNEYIEDEGDATLLNYLVLLQFLKEQEQTLAEFMEDIEASFHPLGQTDPDEYEGTLLGTVHKAKGLEFDRVLIYDDFKFDLIQKGSTLSGKRFEDEAYILYVAITRAKEHLFLSAEAKACLDILARTYRLPELITTPCQSMADVRDTWNEKWDTFQSTRPQIVQVTDVPWPNCSDESNPLALDRKMTEDEQRSHLRRVLLRYHPDKFLPVYGDLIATESHDVIKDKLHEMVRQCRVALRALQNPDER